MLGSDDDSNSDWLEVGFEGIGDLIGESLLHLQSSCERINNSNNLGKADDLAVRNVSNVCGSMKGSEMVFAMRVEGYGSDNDHLITTLCPIFEDLEEFCHIYAIASTPLEPGFSYSFWRFLKARTIDVLAYILKQSQNSVPYLVRGNRWLGVPRKSVPRKRIGLLDHRCRSRRGAYRGSPRVHHSRCRVSLARQRLR